MDITLTSTSILSIALGIGLGFGEGTAHCDEVGADALAIGHELLERTEVRRGGGTGR